MSRYIAVDVGAESGRLVVGTLQDGQLSLAEAHRFSNGPVAIRGSLFWNVLKIFDEIQIGLRKIHRQYGDDFVSLGIDTWADDFALIDADGTLLGNPYCYRDKRTEGMMELALQRVPREAIFQQTAGVQFLSLNTLYQLLSMAVARSPVLDQAATLLMIPDLLNFWLTDRRVVEYTNATTTQFFDSRSRTWSRGLLEQLGIPHHFLPEIVLPGTVLGKLTPAVAQEVGFADLTVTAVATHDTASAVAGVPADSDDFAWLSSGTWSLLGGVTREAIVRPEALEYNFSSYGGPGGLVLPWKNIMGLWLVQDCRRHWAAQGTELSYDELTQMAQDAHPFMAVVNPDNPAFFAPGDMPAAIQTYCRNTGQIVPETRGQIIRTALESLALRYRWTLEKLEMLIGHSYPRLHIVGGGSQNQLLNQFTADATGKPVIAGPVEATALGNVLVQAIAAGQLDSMQAARAVILKSTQTHTVTPRDSRTWDPAYATLNALLAQGK